MSTTRRRASQKAIDELVPLRIIDLPEAEATCMICMEQLVDIKYSQDRRGREHPLRMPCGHVFGSGCLKHWLQSKNTCPVCRKEVDWVEDGGKGRERRESLRSSGSRSSRYSDEFHGLPLVNGPPPARRPTCPPQMTHGAYEPPPHYASGPNPYIRPQTGFLPQSAPHPMGARIQSHRHQRYSSYGNPAPAPRYEETHPLHRPNSATSSNAATTATTQSAPEQFRPYYPEPMALPAPPRLMGPERHRTPFVQKELECALLPMKLCGNEESRRLIQLECSHAYHRDCIRTTMRSRGEEEVDLRSKLLWCEKCRKYYGRVD